MQNFPLTNTAIVSLEPPLTVIPYEFRSSVAHEEIIKCKMPLQCPLELLAAALNNYIEQIHKKSLQMSYIVTFMTFW